MFDLGELQGALNRYTFNSAIDKLLAGNYKDISVAEILSVFIANCR